MFSRRNLARLALVGALALALAGGVLYAAVEVWPGLGAQAVEVLRSLVGDKVVASLEDFVFQIQDTVQQWQYQISRNQPGAPWALAPTPAMLPQVSSAATAEPGAASGAAGMPTPAPLATSAGSAVDQESRPVPRPQPQGPSTPLPWQPAPVRPLGSLAQEGQWSPYLYETVADLAVAPRPVAYRTYLQPDPARPYAVVSIVAVDLTAARLNFVLGSEEPKSSVAFERPGKIPASDLQAGRILAAFNGGFKTEHGQFGVMVHGVTLVPPRPGFGTVALYADGHVQMGAWGVDLKASPDMVWWRQNGPLIIHDGQINPHTADAAPQDWGYTVKGGTATWRSALGLSADGGTLYYAAGPSLTLPALTQAMAATGAAQAIQLDINPYWTHFDAFQVQDGKLTTVPLVEAMGGKAENRYLKGFTRDYFYLTTLP